MSLILDLLSASTALSAVLQSVHPNLWWCYATGWSNIQGTCWFVCATFTENPWVLPLQETMCVGLMGNIINYLGHFDIPQHIIRKHAMIKLAVRCDLPCSTWKRRNPCSMPSKSKLGSKQRKTANQNQRMCTHVHAKQNNSFLIWPCSPWGRQSKESREGKRWEC